MSSPVKARVDVDLNLLREARQEVEEFNLEYCRILDEGRIEEWPNFFAEDPLYRITGRENFDGGFPLGVMYCDSIGMMKDRAYAIAKTLVFSPRICGTTSPTHELFRSETTTRSKAKRTIWSCRRNWVNRRSSFSRDAMSIASSDRGTGCS